MASDFSPVEWRIKAIGEWGLVSPGCGGGDAGSFWLWLWGPKDILLGMRKLTLQCFKSYRHVELRHLFTVLGCQPCGSLRMELEVPEVQVYPAAYRYSVLEMRQC